MKVAVFGGSFNPPHVAHVLGCALVLAVEDVDRLLVEPAYQHPFAKALAPFEDSAAMCELAMGGMPQVEVSRLEAELGGESRTLRTLSHLAETHPDWSMRLVFGGDILARAAALVWLRRDREDRAADHPRSRVSVGSERRPFPSARGLEHAGPRRDRTGRLGRRSADAFRARSWPISAPRALWRHVV